jgi:hypothetical protein
VVCDVILVSWPEEEGAHCSVWSQLQLASTLIE